VLLTMKMLLSPFNEYFDQNTNDQNDMLRLGYETQGVSKFDSINKLAYKLN